MASIVTKSETRFKQIDTDNAATNADDYMAGDIVYDQDDGLLRHNGTSFGCFRYGGIHRKHVEPL